MALVYAVKTGVWSDTTVWNTGSLPTNADVVRPNNFTVTIDIDVDVLELRNDAGGGAVANGSFILNGGVTLDANITVCQILVRFLTFSDNATSSIIGTITNVASNNAFLGVINSGSGTLNITGNIIFTQNNTTSVAQGFIENTSDGIINITGTVNGNTAGANRAQCVVNSSIGTINIVGDVVSPTVQGTLFFTVVNVSTGTITIQGNVTNTASTTIDNRSTGTITITGDVSCSASASGKCIVNGTGTIDIVGDISTSIAASGQNHKVIINGSGTINIVGTVSGEGSSSNATNICIDNESTGTINVTGTVNGIGTISVSFRDLEHCTILNDGGGTVNVTGTINAGTFNVAAGIKASTIINYGSSVNINGNCQGGVGIAVSDNAGTITINGNSIGGSDNPTVINRLTGTINLNGNAVGGTSNVAIQGIDSAGLTIVEKAIYSDLGQTPTSGYIQFKTTDPQVEVLATDLSKITLYDVNQVSGLMPSISDVRSGTTYSNGTLTGSLAVPNPNTVLQGVATDNTVGTLLMTPADFWNYLISNGFASGSIGERLKDSSTVDTTGAQIAAFAI